jgi:hypothetical protein
MKVIIHQINRFSRRRLARRPVVRDHDLPIPPGKVGLVGPVG